MGAHGIKPVEPAGGAAVRRLPQELRAKTATGHNAGRCGHGGKSAARLSRQRRSGRSPRRFAPDLGGLAWARGVVPTPRGDIRVELERGADGRTLRKIEAPDGVDVVVK